MVKHIFIVIIWVSFSQINGQIIDKPNLSEEQISSMQQLIINNYYCLKQTNQLPTVVDEKATKASKTNNLYFDTTCFNFANINVYHSKFSSFLMDSTSNQVCLLDSLFKLHSSISATKFINTRSTLNPGDIHITFSNPIKHNDYYYIETYEIVPDTKYLHYRKSTFKFNKQFELVTKNSWNFYQWSYSGVDLFVETKINITE